MKTGFASGISLEPLELRIRYNYDTLNKTDLIYTVGFLVSAGAK